MTVDEVKERLMQLAKLGLSRLPPDFIERHREPVVTVVMLSYGRLEQTLNAIRALTEHTSIPFNLLLIENGSGDDVQRQLRQRVEHEDSIQLICLSENLGCGGGRAFALDHVRTEYVMFIDNDIEVFPGTVEHLLHCLEAHADVTAVAGNVILPTGLVHLCGGDYQVSNGVLTIELLGFKKLLDDPSIGDSGPCKWVNGGLTMLKKESLRSHPFDPSMEGYYEDLEWCYRLNQLGVGRFYRQVEAVGLHYHEPKHVTLAFAEGDQETPQNVLAVRCVEAIAHFYRGHGQIIRNLFDFIPELGPTDGQVSLASGRIILELINEYGGQWLTECLRQGRRTIEGSTKAEINWRLERDVSRASTAARDQRFDVLIAQLLEQTNEQGNVIKQSRQEIESALDLADERLRWIRMIEQSTAYRVASSFWSARRRLLALLERSGLTGSAPAVSAAAPTVLPDDDIPAP